MRSLLVVWFAVTGLAGCTSMATPPPAAALPTYTFSALRVGPVAIRVLDQRAGERDDAWQSRVEADVRAALRAAGVRIEPGATTVVEVRLLRARSDFELGSWKGCVALQGAVSGAVDLALDEEACVKKQNMWGKATADNVLRLAYEDALAKVLARLDAAR